jgi:hypothetical protein
MYDDLLTLWDGSLSTTTDVVQNEYWPSWTCLKRHRLHEGEQDADGKEGKFKSNKITLDYKGRMKWDQFYSWFYINACTDWAKMSRDGKPFGSPWYVNSDSDAWSRTHEDNGRGLFELPYPHTVIFAVMQFLCGRLTESVHTVNELCQKVDNMRQEKIRIIKTFILPQLVEVNILTDIAIIIMDYVY